MKNFKIHDFPYDAFQEEAIEAIEQGHSVLVSAPTGAGKTVLAEYVTHQALEEGAGIIYTAPIKALSNQKYRDFVERYGREKVGVLTGDVVIQPNAPILIMTTEIFRNRLFEMNDSSQGRRWVIFDEIHYLDDPERGTVWEESLIFLPKNMKVLALSATIPNINELAQWIEKLHKITVKVVVEKSRPVPLDFRFLCQNKICRTFKELHDRGYEGRKGKLKKAKLNRLSTLIRTIQEEKGFPAIYFCFSRHRCEVLAKDAKFFKLVTAEEGKAIVDHFDELCEVFQVKEDKHVQSMRPFVQHGIAYHHAGILPVLKEIVERLFTKRLLKLIFTTETFALGINMPSKTVIFDALRKYYGAIGFDFLRTRDFYQMAGRAGRRGMDEEGWVYSLINPCQNTIGTIKNIINNEPRPVLSQFNSNYATILNLYRQQGDQLLKVYPSSFHFFQADNKGKRKGQQALKDKLNLLKFLGYIDGGELTARGIFASKIYGYELLAAELYMKGFFEEATPEEMAQILVAMIFEPRKNQRFPKIKKRVRPLKQLGDEVWKGINQSEKLFKVENYTKSFYFHLSEPIFQWMRGADLTDIQKIVQVDEGEIIRHFRMVIQILREMKKIDHLPANLINKIDWAINLIKRNEMDAEAQFALG